VDLTFDRWGLAPRPAQQPTSCRSLPSTWLRVKRRPGFSNALAISSPRHRASLLVNLDHRVAQTVLQRIKRSFETCYPSTNPQQHIPVDQLHLSILLPWQRIMVPRPFWVNALSSQYPMVNLIIDRSVAISQYGTPQIFAWRLRDSLEYSDDHAPQTTSEFPSPTSFSAVQSEQPYECVYKCGESH